MAVVGLIPAGGSGERLGVERPKAFALCGGRPLLEWSLDVLREVCDRVVVAVPAGYESGDPDRVTGGPSRSASVRNALAAAPEAEIVLVHDAARPLLEVEIAERCVAAIVNGEADGAVAAARVTDTVKQAGADRRVTRTLERASLWAVQTPQVFGADTLRRALDADDVTLAAATDDAGLVEAAGGSVILIESPRENLKVTTALDLRLAEALLRDRPAN